MKSPFLAFLLSFFVPGLGLAYLGLWKQGLVNFAVVLVIGVLLAFVLSDADLANYMRYVACGLAGGSGALAQFRANARNAELKADRPA